MNTSLENLIDHDSEMVETIDGHSVHLDDLITAQKVVDASLYFYEHRP